jgi:spermidine synthase
MNLSPFILTCFFLSGLAGLIYEVLWVRMIDKVIGSAPFAVATVLAVFMGGLSLGSYLAGRRIDRILEKRKLLSLYGKLEAAIGLYGLMLPIFMVMVKPAYSFAYNHLFQSFWIYSLFTFFGCTLLLIPPTSLMGATLPILCRFYVTHLDHLGARTGRLYGINTIGAAVGACLAGFFLIRQFGVWGSIFFAAGINFLVGISCIIIGRKGIAFGQNPPNSPLVGETFGCELKAERLKSSRFKKGAGQGGPGGFSRDHSKNDPDSSAPQGEPRGGVNWSLWIFAVSGFCAMAYEVIWTRLLGLIIGPTTYSFTLVIATFIIGLALGSLFFGWLGDRVRRAFPLLVLTQIGAALLALFVSQFLGNSQFFFAKLIYTFQDRFGEMILVQSIIVFLVMSAPTLLLGATFPLVAKIYARSLPHMGRSIGTAYALNTIGAISGSFAAGFLLIPFLGKENGLRLIIAFQLAFSLVAWGVVGLRTRQNVFKWFSLSGMAIIGIALLLNFPSWNRQFLSFGRYHNFKGMEGDMIRSSFSDALIAGQKILSRYETGRKIIFYGDGTGGFTTVEKLTDSLGTIKYTLLNSGKPDASSHGDRSTQTLLAHVPLLFHPNPENVMVLGLASGMTAGEALLYPIKRMDALEINRQVVKACEIFRPWNNDCLNDPRSRIIVQDGRNHLELTKETYDVIISEPSNPWMAGLANLYTFDFFRTVRKHLKDNGIFVQWIHSYEMDWFTFSMAGRTFAEVFPDGLLMTTLTGVGDYLLVGFKNNKGLNPNVAEKNLRYAEKSRNMSLKDPRLLFRLIITEDLKGLFGPGPLHTDNRPLLEFAAPKQLYKTDSSIEKRISQRSSLSRRTKEIIEATDNTDALLDMAELSASVYAPIFGTLDPDLITPAQGKRYLDILETYCKCSLVSDYGIFPNRKLREKCALLQAAGIRNHLALNPEDAPAYYSLGQALKQMGKTGEAIFAFQKAISLDPFHVKACNNLGVAFLEQGDIPKAQEAFLKAIYIDPGHSKAYFNLAQIAMRRGERDKALSYLQEGLKHEDNPRARRLLEELR